MKSETVAILNLIDAMPNFSRAEFLADISNLVQPIKFWSAEELAERYGVTEQTIRNWERDKKLVPSLVVGAKCVRYSASDLAEFENKYPGKGV
jgi:transcriptional regulator with XRE-family HTH domain